MNMPSRITAGVDTHLDVHVAAALDERGALLGVEQFATTPAGYAELLGWLERFGTVELAGIEGTGSYGAGLTRFLHTRDITVVEIDRPNRQRRRRRGKSDPQDAITAARSLAPRGSTILLSPGTSSFDQFSGFEQRGNAFRDLVHQLR